MKNYVYNKTQLGLDHQKHQGTAETISMQPLPGSETTRKEDGGEAM